jgi:hypothetical protein
MLSREILPGDLVVFDQARMTMRGVTPPNWDLKAVMVVVWVPGRDDTRQVAVVLMNGRINTVSVKYLKKLET